MALFLDKFKKYTPTGEALRLLSGLSDFTWRSDVERRMIEVDVHFDALVKKDLLYAIEADIAKAYQLNSVRLFPKYPKELFSLSYMHEVIYEAYRVGIVSRGFFENYSLSEENGEIVVAIGFSSGALSLLCRAETDKLLERIIDSEFSLRKTVRIAATLNDQESYDAFAAANKRELEKMYFDSVERVEKQKEEQKAKGRHFSTIFF